MAVGRLTDLLPGRRPMVEHEDSCPIAAAARTLFRDDVTWLTAHPTEPARIRGLAACEAADMETALGRRVRPDDRGEWTVAVARADAARLVRTYESRGRVVAVQVSGEDAEVER